jgi:hypothetical protein
LIVNWIEFQYQLCIGSICQHPSKKERAEAVELYQRQEPREAVSLWIILRKTFTPFVVPASRNRRRWILPKGQYCSIEVESQNFQRSKAPSPREFGRADLPLKSNEIRIHEERGLGVRSFGHYRYGLLTTNLNGGLLFRPLPLGSIPLNCSAVEYTSP